MNISCQKNWVPIVMMWVALLVGPTPAHAGEDHPHHISLFGGAKISSGQVAPLIGAEYEFRLEALNGLLGIGVVTDAAFGDHTTLVVGPGLFIHPAGDLVLVLVPALETDFSHEAFALIFSTIYHFHVGDLTVSPKFDLEYANNHLAYITSLGIGIGF